MQQQLINQRQQYLDEYRERTPSQHVGKIFYDHDVSLARSVRDAHAKRLISDPRLNERYLMFVISAGRQFVSNLLIKELLSSDKSREMYEKMLKKRLREDIERTDISAACLQYPFDFGEGKKTDIYFFREPFEVKFELHTKKGIIEIPASAKLEEVLMHEYHHAEQNYKGIDFGDGLSINQSNYYTIAPDVRSFVEEVDAYSRTYYDMQSLGMDTHQFLSALQNFLGYYNTLFQNYEYIYTVNLTSLEMKLVEIQLSNLKRLLYESVIPFITEKGWR